MLFNSWIFLIFLPFVWGIYYVTPQKFKWALLLISSYIFYGWWRWEFTGLIILSTLIDYWIAIKIFETNNLFQKKIYLYISLILNLGLLIIFKYFYFFGNQIPIIQDLAQKYYKFKLFIEFLGYSLPVGISFYTFQSMSYSIDVYRGNTEPEKHLGKFALYVSFFPQLVAGPIERFGHLHSELTKKFEFNYQLLQSGFRLILYGFFVKMVIADNLSYNVGSVFDNPGKWYNYWVWIGVLSFSFQIYADFYGYSLIAQGVAKLFGINLMDNFKKPYVAKSIIDFWKRWHISLTSWFRDYLYLPLGGNKVKTLKWILNILLVFLISGLWHGANYTFIFWGLIHSFYYFGEKFIPFKIKNNFLNQLKTYLLVCFAWIFFRAKDMENAFEVIKRMFFETEKAKNLDTQWYIFLLVLIFILFEKARKNERFDVFCNQFKSYQRWVLYCFLIFCIITLCGTDYQPFIYFRF